MKRAVLALAALTAACHHTPSDSGLQCPGVQVPDEGRLHVDFGTPVTYQNNPPASGSHWPCWAPYAVSSVVVPDEAWVHNLEHGAIVLLYQCADATSCPDAGAQLVPLFETAPDAPTGGHRLLVTAFPALPTPFAAVAWDWVYTTSEVDAGAFQCFIAEHEGQGPEDISADGTASCL